MKNRGTRGHTEKGQRQGGTAGGTTSAAAASARDAASIAQCRTTSNPAVDACPGLASGLALRCRATVARSAGRPGPGVRKYFRPTFVRPSVSPSANIGCWLPYTRQLFSFVQEQLPRSPSIIDVHPSADNGCWLSYTRRLDSPSSKRSSRQVTLNRQRSSIHQHRLLAFVHASPTFMRPREAHSVILNNRCSSIPQRQLLVYASPIFVQEKVACFS